MSHEFISRCLSAVNAQGDWDRRRSSKPDPEPNRNASSDQQGSPLWLDLLRRPHQPAHSPSWKREDDTVSRQFDPFRNHVAAISRTCPPMVLLHGGQCGRNGAIEKLHCRIAENGAERQSDSSQVNVCADHHHSTGILVFYEIAECYGFPICVPSC